VKRENLGMEKKFISNSHSLYREAVLVKSQSKGIDKWYIEFYQSTGSTFLQIYRPTFELNRIRNKKERKALAEDLIEFINDQLAKGDEAHNIILEGKKLARKAKFKVVVNPFPQRQTKTSEAIKTIVDIKCADASDASKETYKHIRNHFLKFIEKAKIDSKSIAEFNKVDAIGFMDWLALRGIGDTTYNYRLSEITTLFNDLKGREYVVSNPFSDIKPKKIKRNKTPRRRAFTDEEAALVGKTIFEKSIWLFRAIILENYCSMRPAELRRIRFKDFDLNEGVVNLNADIVFKSKPRYATIPKIVLPYFQSEDFTKEPLNNFVFGAQFIPNPRKSVSRNYCSKMHKAILDDLHAKGLLKNREGLEFYSWKNTGITNLANDAKVGIFKAQNQAGHHSPTETMRYYRQSKVDEAIRQYDKKIF
jgi:integrase